MLSEPGNSSIFKGVSPGSLDEQRRRRWQRTSWSHHLSALALVWALAAPLALAGCFGDNDGGGPGGEDGDATLKIVATQAPEGIDAEGGRAQVTLELAAKPEETLTVELRTTLGTFAALAPTVTTDAEGKALVTASLTSGAESGEAMISAVIGNGEGDTVSAELTIRVTPLTRVGEVAQLPNADSIAPNFLEGQSITLAAPGTLRKVGIVAPVQDFPAPRVAVGIYADAAGVPTQLLATATATLAAGVNELEVTPVAVGSAALPAGTYWFMLALDRRSLLYRSNRMRPLKYVSRTFSTMLPAIYPAHNQQDEEQRNVYLVVGR